MTPLMALPIIVAWLALPLLVMTAQPGHPLVVQVVTEAGLPVREVQVAVFAPDGSRLDAGRTDTDGRYHAVFADERVALDLAWTTPTGAVLPLGTVNEVDTMRLWIDLTIGDPEVAFVVTERAIILAPSMLAPDVGESLLADPFNEPGATAGTIPPITPLPFPTSAPAPANPGAPSALGGWNGWAGLGLIGLLVVVLMIVVVRVRQGRNPQ